MRLAPAATLTLLEGSPGLTIGEVQHALIPGRGRNADATGISPASADRLDTGAGVYTELHMGGNFIMCGYKTPGDTNGTAWRPDKPGYEGPTYQGVPEAYGMDSRLDTISPELQKRFGRTVPSDRRRIEAASIDTSTNLAQAEARYLFGEADEQPVAIFSQEEHLERILGTIARKTLRRPYIGVVVPERPESPDRDGLAPRIASGLITFGVSVERHNPARVIAITDRRARRVWRAALAAQRLLGSS